MRKLLMLAGALSLLATPALAGSGAKYKNQVSPGTKQSAQVPTQGRDREQPASSYQPAPGTKSHATGPTSPTPHRQRNR
jgi:hypothetical protein